MTSISSTSGSTSVWSAQQVGTARRGADQGGPLQSVSSLLDASVEDLQDELAGGKSLSDIADEKGVSHDDLIAALKAGMPDDAASGAAATAVAEQMAA